MIPRREFFFCLLSGRRIVRPADRNVCPTFTPASSKCVLYEAAPGILENWRDVSTMSDLIPPHGGLSAPVCCMVPADERDSFRENASKLTPVPVSDADLSTVYRFGDGGLSPLTGPMDSETYHRVLDESVIAYNGKLYAWTIPLALPIGSDLAGRLEVGQTVALARQDGQIVGSLDISDVFPWDKQAYLKSVYLTERTDHPGADMVLNGDTDKTHLLGGSIRVLLQPKHPAFGRYMHTPAEVRRHPVAKRAGSVWLRFRPETRCTAPTNTPLFTDWKR